jgi:hypothetical protein
MIDDESGEYIPPAKTYLDDVEVYDAELGGVVPAWKSLIYHGAKARRFAQLRRQRSRYRRSRGRWGRIER